MGTWCSKSLGICVIYMDMYTKDIVQIIKNRSHTMSHAMWACHLYPVAAGTLFEARGVTYQKY